MLASLSLRGPFTWHSPQCTRVSATGLTLQNSDAQRVSESRHEHIYMCIYTHTNKNTPFWGTPSEHNLMLSKLTALRDEDSAPESNNLPALRHL